MENLYIYEKNGRRRKAEKYNCEQCGKEFLRREKVASNREKPKFCSRKCSGKARENRIYIECEQCGKEFLRIFSKLKNSRHDKHFCSRKCKEYAQSLDGDCIAIRPPHYGN